MQNTHSNFDSNFNEVLHLSNKLKKFNKRLTSHLQLYNIEDKEAIISLQDKQKNLALSIKEKINLCSTSSLFAKKHMKYVSEALSNIASYNINLLHSYEVIQLVKYKDEPIGELLFKCQTTNSQQEKSNLFSDIKSNIDDIISNIDDTTTSHLIKLALSKKTKEDLAHELRGDYEPEDDKVKNLLIKFKEVGEDQQKEVVDEIIFLLSDNNNDRKYGSAYIIKVLQAISDFNNGFCADYVAEYLETQKQILKRYFYRPFNEIKEAISRHVENNNDLEANRIKELPQHIKEAINNKDYVAVFKFFDGLHYKVRPMLNIENEIDTAIARIEFLPNDKEKYECLKEIVNFQDEYSRFHLVRIARQIPSYNKEILEILSPTNNNDCSLYAFMGALLEGIPTKPEIDYAVKIFLKIRGHDEVLEEASLKIYPYISNNQTYKQAVIHHINAHGDKSCKKYLEKQGIPLTESVMKYQKMVTQQSSQQHNLQFM